MGLVRHQSPILPERGQSEEIAIQSAQKVETTNPVASKGVSLAFLIWLAGFFLLALCIFVDLLIAIVH